MAQLDTTNTFVGGDVVDAASMNNIIDQAFSQDDIIHDQTLLTGTIDAVNDEVLIWHDVAPPCLRRAKINKLPSGVTSVSMTVAPSAVFAITGTPITTTGTLALSLKSQGANKVLCGPVSGAATTPTFRLLTPADIGGDGAVNIAANIIDLTLGNVFVKQLTTGVLHFKVNNGVPGQRVTVIVFQNQAPGTATVDWDTNDTDGVIRWPGGTDHTMTTGGVGKMDQIYFTCIGSGSYNGTFDKDFLP